MIRVVSIAVAALLLATPVLAEPFFRLGLSTNLVSVGPDAPGGGVNNPDETPMAFTTQPADFSAVAARGASVPVAVTTTGATGVAVSVVPASGGALTPPYWISSLFSGVIASPPRNVSAGEYGPYRLQLTATNRNTVESDPFTVTVTEPVIDDAATTIPGRGSIMNPHLATSLHGFSAGENSSVAAAFYDGLDTPIVTHNLLNVGVAQMVFDNLTLGDSCFIRFYSTELPATVGLRITGLIRPPVAGMEPEATFGTTASVSRDASNYYSYVGPCFAEGAQEIDTLLFDLSTASYQDFTLTDFRFGNGGVFPGGSPAMSFSASPGGISVNAGSVTLAPFTIDAPGAPNTAVVIETAPGGTAVPAWVTLNGGAVRAAPPSGTTVGTYGPLRLKLTSPMRSDVYSAPFSVTVALPPADQANTVAASTASAMNYYNAVSLHGYPSEPSVAMRNALYDGLNNSVVTHNTANGVQLQFGNRTAVSSCYLRFHSTALPATVTVMFHGSTGSGGTNSTRSVTRNGSGIYTYSGDCFTGGATAEITSLNFWVNGFAGQNYTFYEAKAGLGGAFATP